MFFFFNFLFSFFFLYNPFFFMYMMGFYFVRFDFKLTFFTCFSDLLLLHRVPITPLPVTVCTRCHTSTLFQLLV